MPKLFNRARLMLSILVLFACAQSLAQPAAAPGALMWKVTTPTTTVYMLGSVHMVDQSLYPLAKPVEDAFHSSKVLVVEVNMKNIDQQAAMAMVQSRGIYTDGSALSKHISKPTSDALDSYCAEQGIPRAALEPMKPWFAGLTVSMLPLVKAGMNPNQGIDMHFMNTISEGQRIEELETAEYQLDLLASGTEEEQEKSLASSLKQAPKMLERLRTIQQAFLAGDDAAIQKLMDESIEGQREFAQRLIDNRNVGMVSKIEGYLKGKEQAFVVVGAAHFVGPKGIVQMLRDKNYKVEQVK